MNLGDGSDATKTIKFRAFVVEHAYKFSFESKLSPVYNIDYNLDCEKLGVIALTEIGQKFLAYLANECTKVDKPIEEKEEISMWEQEQCEDWE
jgi:hypothetical protein